MNTLKPEISPDGPYFVSYRQSDGTDTAVPVAWLLRAAGLPVWHDQTDLPPGNTETRLDEALTGGLAGAVLVVTPEMQFSGVVRHRELPKLLELDRDPRFGFGIANTVRSTSGRVDYAAPDRILDQVPGTLSNKKQHSVDTAGERRQLIRDLVIAHIHQKRAAIRDADSTIRIMTQTRTPPQAWEEDTADLKVRIRPGQTGRLPNLEGLEDLALALPIVADGVSASGAKTVHISGGMHLSVALAVGAALPSTIVRKILVEDVDGNVWVSGPATQAHSDPELLVRHNHLVNTISPDGSSKVLVYMDLMPTPSDAALKTVLRDRAGEFVSFEHFKSRSGQMMSHTDAPSLAAEMLHKIKKISGENSNAEIHLLFRGPYALAVLLGRLLNTLRVVAYEWDDTPTKPDSGPAPRYEPVLTLCPSVPEGPISRIHPRQEPDAVMATATKN
ncbi:SAVED domain-containing protein [Arthrobacter sp. FW306-2-2C-D06B]|uniref:SAVED domain-containing protein n=1 Tax=Arthrobacter sp. FW306-2-2C-D06B TaxID=2879618 RepID=UPI001F3280A9|nr:SAVED domain-containing protein [Arthrobacter sp. FW306-2-2C-D06B]UKA58241.1 SAVED domain-containing protein [Arthrobacter sp. FW306-2-2C-D06B]